MISAKHARLDQYSQLLQCEKDAKEVTVCFFTLYCNIEQQSIAKLFEILRTLEDKRCTIGTSLEETGLYLTEFNEQKEEIEVFSGSNLKGT